jgi:O-antigen/teichoic acid export membrane protein
LTGGRRSEITSAWRVLMSLQAGQAAALVTTAVGVILVSRLLGPGGYGGLTLAMAAAQYIIVLVVSWTSASVVRFGREEFVRAHQMRGVFGTRLAIALVCLAIASVLVWVFRTRVSGLTGIPESALDMLVVLSLALTLADHVDGTLQASGDWTRYAWLGAVEKISFVCVVAIVFAAGAPSLRLILMAAVAAQIARIAFGSPRILRVAHVWPPRLDARIAARILAYSWPLWFMFAVGYFSAFVEPFLIDRYVDTASVGVYQVAYQVSLLCGALLAPAGTMLFPALTTLRSQQRDDVIRTLLERLVPQASFILSLVVAVGMVVVPFVFPTLFGAGYEGGLRPLQVLLIAVAFQALTILYGPVLAAYDMTKETAALNTFGGIAVHLVPQLLLIPRFGTTGAAFSWVIWYVCSATVVVLLVERRLGLHLRFVLLSPVTAAAAGVLVLSLGPMAGALSVLLLVVGAVVWVRTTRLFLREDARLLEAIGVPVVIQRPAMFVYGALSN